MMSRQKCVKQGPYTVHHVRVSELQVLRRRDRSEDGRARVGGAAPTAVQHEEGRVPPAAIFEVRVNIVEGKRAPPEVCLKISLLPRAVAVHVQLHVSREEKELSVDLYPVAHEREHGGALVVAHGIAEVPESLVEPLAVEIHLHLHLPTQLFQRLLQQLSVRNGVLQRGEASALAVGLVAYDQRRPPPAPCQLGEWADGERALKMAAKLCLGEPAAEFHHPLAPPCLIPPPPSPGGFQQVQPRQLPVPLLGFSALDVVHFPPEAVAAAQADFVDD
eukprot:768121-Hanusia_phi.AAC.1